MAVRLKARLDPDVAAVAALIADPSRVAMLDALLGGVPLTASELARRAGVAASTASFHLARLLAGRLIVRRRRGRMTELALAGRRVARALEALARLAPAATVVTAGQGRAAAELRQARMCYDHLAGRVGVAIADALLARGVLVARGAAWSLADAAAPAFAALDLSLDLAAPARRPLVRICLDWSERRPHIAGALGQRLAERLLGERLLVRVPGGRTLRLTRRGEAWLGELQA